MPKLKPTAPDRNPTKRSRKSAALKAGKTTSKKFFGTPKAVNVVVKRVNIGERRTLGAVVRARIDATIKDEATTVLAAVGITPSDAFRMLMMRVVSEKALPFEPLIPNHETIEAMQAARHGELTTVRSVKDLFATLNADD